MSKIEEKIAQMLMEQSLKLEIGRQECSVL